ncbi:unnamed protein product [Durusdinium trenchii]|uniref:Apple domain-containing protein n=2 Tax=Durusdinium trenchii TaxID=1381693 RepID=A0ABP0R7V8_9DINO
MLDAIRRLTAVAVSSLQGSSSIPLPILRAMLCWVLAALLVQKAAAGCSDDNTCSSSGALWLQLKGSRSFNKGVAEPDFFPVHGGVGRSCRGSHADDNLAGHYISTAATSMEDCKQLCLSNSACKGIEFNRMRCKVWTRREGIQASHPLAGSTCLRLLQDASAMNNFREVNGGRGKGCRGSHPGDKEESYFKSTTATTLDECKSICVQDADCQGVSYKSRGLCEVWVRSAGIEATEDEEDSVCLEVPGPTTTTGPGPTTTAPVTDRWEKHEGLNCYKGHGAKIINGKDPVDGRLTLQQCKDECLKEEKCDGIVMPQGDGEDTARNCWLRRDVQKSKCTAGSPYNFWAQPDSDIDGPEVPGTECCQSYDKWPFVKDGRTCSGCMALVKTEPFGGRCDKYCESFGHECVTAAEEVNNNCAIKYSQDCDKPIEGTSDMLCTCRLQTAVDEPKCDWPGPPPPTTTTTTTTAAPTTSQPINNQCCPKFDKWPDVDNGVTCGDCVALVLAEKYGGRCDRYCESFGQVCVRAAEERDENCEVKYEASCNEAITGTSDILCQCVENNAPPGCPATTTTTSQTPSPTKRIQVVGNQILVDGAPLHLKGVAWNPVPKGGVHPADLDFARFVDEDSKLMQEMGINAVRTYESIVDKNVLDTLWKRGIWVVNSVYNWGGADADSAAEPVKATKDHPAILMWTIGNEWNYNGLYVGSSFFDSVGKIRDVARVVKKYDNGLHPIASIYGDVGKLDQAVDSLPEIDLWGINAYRGISFGNLFRDFEKITGKPMFFGEYGADAFNADKNGEDQESQAKATRQLTEEIIGQSSVLGRGPCIGGFIFEFNDEWHKDSDGKPDRHDTGGTAPGGGPYPDMTFNEDG